MNKAKRNRLVQEGWKFTTVKEFLGLTDAEDRYIEAKLDLSAAIKAERQALRLTQVECAKILGSSQSRVAKMESGDPSVSLDLLFRSLIKLQDPKLSNARSAKAAKKKSRKKASAAAPRKKRAKSTVRSRR